ncbi:MAG: serine/threonine protein kinase [Kiritimatiellia bacterium]|jgi:serine/threonine protein kinase
MAEDTDKKAATEDVKLKISAERVGRFSCTRCKASIEAEEHEIFSKVPCPACSATQRVPGQMGTFLIYSVLGRGAISVVFKAIDTLNGREVALKVSHRIGRKPLEFYDDYLGEAKATTFLNHPNIVRIYDYGFANRYPYIAMEIVEGGTLKDLIARNLWISEKRVMKIALDIAEGLHVAHLAGIVHGDMKPANVLNHRDQVYKIADFGNWNMKGKQENVKIFGTPYYIAPEKVQHKVEDHRSDMYSLGATLWHSLAGYPPHDGKNVKEVVQAHLKKEVPDLQHANITISNGTARVVKTMMAADPEDRYQKYPDLIAAIKQVQAEEQLKETHPGDTPVKET